MNSLDSLYIGLRSQDFHEGLKLTANFPVKDVHYKKTILIGKAATLAMHLRGLLYIENYQSLEYAASNLGINAYELERVICELEEVDFVRVTRSGENIKRIEVKVPEFRSGYSDLGERWKQLNPSELEVAGITILNYLIKKPVSRTSLFSSLGIDNRNEAMICDVMRAGHLLDIQPVAGEEIVYSPLAVDGNPIIYLDWAKKFLNEVGETIDFLKNNQGIPVTDKMVSSNTAINVAIHTGVIMPVQVSGATGEQQFLFAPVGNLASEERIILDKALAILSCVRYGEKFAAGRRIMNPKSIIRTLRENKRFSTGHPDLFSQYSLLVEKMIGHPDQDSRGYWNFAVDDTAENMKAFDIALEMISEGEAPSAKIDLDVQKTLLAPTSYQSPISTRARFVNLVQLSPESKVDAISQMANLARGVN